MVTICAAGPAAGDAHSKSGIVARIPECVGSSHCSEHCWVTSGLSSQLATLGDSSYLATAADRLALLVDKATDRYNQIVDEACYTAGKLQNWPGSRLVAAAETPELGVVAEVARLEEEHCQKGTDWGVATFGVVAAAVAAVVVVGSRRQNLHGWGNDPIKV